MGNRMTKLSRQQMSELAARLPAWEVRAERGGTLTRRFVFHDFAQAFGFMGQVAVHADRRNHHPEWSNVYNRVDVTLTTHDAEGLSHNDVEMAQLMDRVAAALATQTR